MSTTLDKEILTDLYLNMLRARRFEEKILEMYQKNLIHGTAHLGIGQEASGVGAAMAAVKNGDLVILTHRGHNQAIGMGGDLSSYMGEMLGKAGGCAHGKGGSMHFFDLERGNIGETGVVGGGFPLACGMALTQQYNKTGKAVLCCAGDGAVNTGNFHESMNFAAVKKLPVVFFIENNLYAMSTPIEENSAVITIADRAQAYGIPGMTIDGNDAIEVYKIVLKALDYARSGEGPFLIESLTYRQCGHSKSDKQVYRDQQEVESWKKEDPIVRLSDYMKAEGLITDDELYSLDRQALDAVVKATDDALAMDEPSPETVFTNLYAK